MGSFYWVYITNTFKKNLTYRFGYFTDVAGVVLSIVVQYFIWKALLGREGVVTDYGFIEFGTMQTYAVLSSIISYVTASYLLDNVGSKILKGTIATDLVRPVSIKRMYFCEWVGNVLFRLIFVLLPIIAVSFPLLQLPLPDTVTLLVAIIALLNGFMIIFFLEFAVGVLGFWFTQVHSLGVLLWTSIMFFSGALIPLWFFPQWLQMLAGVMPFRFIYFVPLSIFTGTYSHEEAVLLIAQQVVWVLVSYLVGCILYTRGIKKLTVLGG